MSFAGQDVREQVRMATDIVDLVGSYIELRRQGRNFVARCPWHDDRRPSLQVNPERQSWKCWVCNIGGDVFSFVMQKERVEFREALQLLADRAGITITQKKSVAQPGSPDDKNTLYQAMAWAEQQFQDCLNGAREAEPARRYLAERGITAESIQRFRLGYSPDNWQWLLDRSRGTPHSAAVLEACGLVGRGATSGNLYDRFKGRVIFPIHDLQARPIAFGGRILPGLAQENAAKYVNSPETRLFTKSDNLYALELARDAVVKSRGIIVVEGYTDVVISHQTGLNNVVAVLGTAINQRHLRLIKRFADTIYLVLDGDEAGQNRTNDVLELFVAEQMDLRIMTLPEGLDPADFLLEHSADAFRELLGGAVDALEHKIRVSTRGINLTHDTHQANRALEGILSTIGRAPRLTADAMGAARLREQQILARLAREFLVDELELRERLKQLRRATAPTHAGTTQATVGAHADEEAAAAPPILLKSLPPREVELIEILLLNPAFAPQTFDEVSVDDLMAGPVKQLFGSLRFLHEQGEPLDFHHVLSELDDMRLKSLLVQLDDSGRAKAETASEPPETRLAHLVHAFRARREERARREAEEALKQGKLAFEQEILLLKESLERERNRRGLTAPTEG